MFTAVKNELRIKELSAKLFKGDMFVVFSEEEMATDDYKEYEVLVAKKQAFRKKLAQLK